MRRFPVLFAAILLVLAVELCRPSASCAANAAEGNGPTTLQLKAAFLYNFAKFTEWPPDAVIPAQQLSLCIAGDNALAAVLERLVAGKTIEGHEFVVVLVNTSRPITWCHVLYASRLDARDSAQLFEVLQDAPVLTVSDGDAFAKRGGIAGLVREQDRMRFVINLSAAKRARLTLSSNLLHLATIVKDKSDVDR